MSRTHWKSIWFLKSPKHIIPYQSLPIADKIFLNKCPKPVILVERLDSAVTWFRDFSKIPNLRAVFKNRIVKDAKLNNGILWNGRHHYYLMIQCQHLYAHHLVLNVIFYFPIKFY